MRRTTLLLILATAGGCASHFRYDPDDSAPPPAQLRPTTVPSHETPTADSVGGTMRLIFVEYPGRLYDQFSGNTPSRAVLDLENSGLPDRRRQGINELVERRFGKAPPYTTRYQQIAQYDADPSVRAAAIRALNRSRDGSATSIFIDALADDSPAVRLEGAKALSNVPDPDASGPLLKLFQDTNQPLDVRIAAADALRQYHTLENARALVNVLQDRDFGLSWQARQSLRSMTGQDKRYDQAAWLDVLTGPNGTFG